MVVPMDSISQIILDALAANNGLPPEATGFLTWSGLAILAAIGLALLSCLADHG